MENKLKENQRVQLADDSWVETTKGDSIEESTVADAVTDTAVDTTADTTADTKPALKETTEEAAVGEVAEKTYSIKEEVGVSVQGEDNIILEVGDVIQVLPKK